MENDYKYPIKAVSEITGLTVHAIRAWEKRYNAVEPARTDTNRRLYSSRDLEKLTLLKKATEYGHSISGIASLSVEELIKLLGKNHAFDEKAGSMKPQTTSNGETKIQRFVDAMNNYDGKKLEELLHHASVEYSRTKLLENLITPLIITIGDMWHKGEIRVSHEHFATSIIRKFLLNLLEAQNIPETAPNIVICTPKGQTHELGALVVANFAANEGWNVTYLGADLPMEDVVSAAEETKSRVICFSIVYPSDDIFLVKEFERLDHICPPDITILAGGASVGGYKEILKKVGAIIIEDNSGLSDKFRLLRKF